MRSGSEASPLADESYLSAIDISLQGNRGISQYNKLWSEDSGRNLAGTQSGTLRGIFPKLVVQFKKLEKDELEAIAPILDAPKQIVKYYDPYKQAVVEMQTYTGDYEVVNKGIVETSDKRIYKNEGFSISFIAVKRRA